MLNLDPKTPATVTIDGETYLIRVMTQREMFRFGVNSEAVSARLRSAPEGEPAVLGERDVDNLERCLCIGIAGWESTALPPWKADRTGFMDPALLDAIPVGNWMAIYTEIIRANSVTAAEAKNSSSP